MGIIIPPHIDGTHCSVCWDPGYAFENKVTPKYITIEIIGVEKGPGWTAADGEPINGTFQLIQTSTLPCTWTDTGIFPYKIRWGVSSVGASMTIYSTTGAVMFTTGALARCALTGNNLQNWKFVNGSFVVTLP